MNFFNNPYLNELKLFENIFEIFSSIEEQAKKLAELKVEKPQQKTESELETELIRSKIKQCAQNKCDQMKQETNQSPESPKPNGIYCNIYK